jgi:glycyl-tRNA synthetase
MSRYYLDDADMVTTRRLFEDYAAEARRMLDVRLPVPAHYYVLKCSHSFNVLDARGAVSTTERAKAFGRMRALAREVAQLWAQRRAELGHPLGVCDPLPAATVPAELPQVSALSAALFEIGTEELPAAEVSRTAEAVRQALADRLAATPARAWRHPHLRHCPPRGRPRREHPAPRARRRAYGARPPDKRCF